MTRLYRTSMRRALEALQERNYSKAVDESEKMLSRGENLTERLAAMTISMVACIKNEDAIAIINHLARLDDKPEDTLCTAQ